VVGDEGREVVAVVEPYGGIGFGGLLYACP
jgi:hypothetical protein